MAVDMVHEGLIDRKTALQRVAEVDVRLAATRFAVAADSVARGIASPPGVACGRVAFDSRRA